MIVKQSKDDDKVEIKINDIRTIIVTENSVSTKDCFDDGEPIVKKYDFADLELMNDTLAIINAPLYSQINKLKKKIDKQKPNETSTNVNSGPQIVTMNISMKDIEQQQFKDIYNILRQLGI